MTDAVLGNHAAVAGAVERGLAGLVSASPSGSAASDGASGTITVAHLSRYQMRETGVPVDDFSVILYCQADTDPPIGDKQVLASKDAFGMPGGWSIERFHETGSPVGQGFAPTSATPAVLRSGSAARTAQWHCRPRLQLASS